MSDAALVIEEWDPSHPRWPELLALIEAQGQHDWVIFLGDWHLSSHLLVARRDEVLVGFLRFVVQEIGPDADCPPIMLDGGALTEAKVLAFAVDTAHQRRGIGRALQIAGIQRARALGCYQVRSHSSGDNTANHRLKLAMGFGVHPIVRGQVTSGVYFVLPLAAHDWEE